MSTSIGVLVLAVGMGQAYADQIIASSTGLTSPAETITFSEIPLAMNTVVTNQYAGLGVSFSPEVFYDPQTSFGNITADDVGNFTFNGDGPVDPTTLTFSSVLTGAAFSFEADTTPYQIQAFLGGTLVDSFTTTVTFFSAGPAPDFYGFSNESFDSITITQEGAGGGPDWLISNIQLSNGAASVPEPSAIVLLGTALLGVAARLRRKNA